MFAVILGSTPAQGARAARSSPTSPGCDGQVPGRMQNFISRLRIPGVDRQLGGEGPFVCGPRFAAGDVGGQVRELVQKARRSEPEQHRHHHQVARAEGPIEPVGIAQAGRELDQSIANAVLDQRQALFGPGLVALRELGGHEFEDRRLHGVERGEHPGDRPRPRVGIVREQARMVLGDVEDDRARLEQGEIAFLIGRDQAERMKAQMRGFLSSRGTRRGEPRRAGPPLQAPSERAYRAPGPCRHRATARRR